MTVTTCANRLRKQAFFLIAAACLSAATPAKADLYLKWDCQGAETPMRQCLRMGGLKRIFLYGSIGMSDAVELLRIDTYLKGDAKLPTIYVDSIGGSLGPAEMIGRMLRRRQARIETKNIFDETYPAQCSSACVTVAAGAVDRQLSHIGVHQPHKTIHVKAETHRYEPSDSSIVDATLDFFDDMGINPELKEVIKKTPWDTIAEFNYDATKPDEEQEIVRWGFRMTPTPKSEIKVSAPVVAPKFMHQMDQWIYSAEHGDADAAFRIGRVRLRGDQTYKAKPDEAVKWLEKAGAMGSSDAYYHLGLAYDNGWGVEKNVPKALEAYEKAVAKGHGPAMNNLGFILYEGRGVKKNLSRAIHLITRAVDNGGAFAYGSLGEIMLNGNGFPRNDVETYKWLKLAQDNMSAGPSRDGNLVMLNKVKARMTAEQISIGDKLVKAWVPLSGRTTSTLDKEN